MKKFFTLAAALCVALPMMAAEPENNTVSEFGSEEKLESGFLTGMLNNAIASGMEAPAANEEMKYGRTITDYVSAPKFGGYIIGKYAYKDMDNYPTVDKDGNITKWNNTNRGDGFTQRLVRFYVDGTILKDFAYRIQIQTNDANFHMKDFFVEWRKYKFAQIKIGQFKRAFGFENPMNPWDISTGDYSLMTKLLTGHSDYLGADAASNGGRDQGIQVQGDFLPVGKDKHMLFHYQLMVSNGTGINSKDNDGNKDITGTFQVQPVKGLFIGFFGWKGTFRTNGVDHSRNRYAFGAKYDKNGYCFRTEYAHGQSDLGNADAWYVVGAAPLNSWFRVSAQYQTARVGKDWGKAQRVFSVIPEFQLHKNLKIQLQYNYNDVSGTADRHYNELWVETYFRF